MTQVVYADVLVIVNTYVNFALLRASGMICKREASALRILLSSFFGGFCSMIILVNNISDWVIALSRVAVCAVMLVIAYGIVNKRAFLRICTCFLAVSFAFAGIMFALWIAFAPSSMIYSSGIVYFNINTAVLFVLTIVCYLVMITVNKLVSFRSPKNTIYNLEVSICGAVFEYQALLDTGNSLREPFSGYPVIIVDNCVKSKDGTTISQLIEEQRILPRLVPCSTVSSSGVIQAVRPERVQVGGMDISFETCRVYIGITNGKIKNGDYTALLSSEIFENRTKETEADYVQNR